MASPASSIITAWSELVSTTYRAHSKDVADQVTKHNALFRRLTEKGRTRVEDGGLTIVQPLDYQANSTYQRYSGFDVLNINAVDVLTSAEFPWRQVAVNVAALLMVLLGLQPALSNLIDPRYRLIFQRGCHFLQRYRLQIYRIHRGQLLRVRKFLSTHYQLFHPLILRLLLLVQSGFPDFPLFKSPLLGYGLLSQQSCFYLST